MKINSQQNCVFHVICVVLFCSFQVLCKTVELVWYGSSVALNGLSQSDIAVNRMTNTDLNRLPDCLFSCQVAQELSHYCTLLLSVPGKEF